ncbi:MAG: ADP-ribosylglycohydrolase family protein [Gammaproteobacteria bacterium]|nr:ADP-ribosylglycohydrolase family protein [Gammaproteobacteria bacterium]
MVKPTENNIDTTDRYRGALLGLAAGDAVGTALEFRPPGSFDPIQDMVGGGPFGLKPGQWTDDTAMALCLADSLLARRGFDAADQMDRYTRWYREGYLSSTGQCFDIGNTVRAALERYAATGDPLAGSTDPRSAGNGSLMRLAPIPMAWAGDPNAAIDQAAMMSRTTHGAVEAVDACRYYAGLMSGALNGVPKDELLAPRYHPVAGQWPEGALAPKIEAIAAGSFLHRSPPDIRGTGYVVQSLEAALWAFASTDDFRAAVLAAVNLGDDADTTGAIVGQLAGAHYGASAIPADWRNGLAMKETIEGMAGGLFEFANVK